MAAWRTAMVVPIEAPDVLRVKQDVPILIASQYAQQAIERTIREKMKLANPLIKLFAGEIV